ncbi:MAG TPA: transglutaminase-like domain-containing protein [Rudaea sp.]
MHRFSLLLALVAVSVHAAPADETWMSVLLSGRKIGSMHTTRVVHGERVVTRQQLRIELDRAGTRIALTTSETDEETLAGAPLAFESRTQMSGSETLVRGRIVDGHSVEVTSTIGGAAHTRTLEWPRGALLAEGLRLAEESAGTATGTRYSNLAFQPDNLEAITIDSSVAETAPVDLPDGKQTLTRIEQAIHLPDAPTRAEAWIDRDQNVAKLVMPVMGYELTMLACTRDCAQAPNQSADILVHALVAAPRALSADERRRGLRLLLSAADHGEPLKFAQTDEQRVRATGATVELSIAPVAASSTMVESKPDAADFHSNDWLQSDAPEVVALAKLGAGDATAAGEQMQRLENFVRGYIRNKDLSVGYASALEVARNPEGDCTEHAVLLAALGRALGIATRVVDGIVYVDNYAGQQHVFVPHAWTQAFIDGHWRSYDAALHGFDAGHVALSFGDGDPWRFFAGFNALGRMRVNSAEPVH